MKFSPAIAVLLAALLCPFAIGQTATKPPASPLDTQLTPSHHGHVFAPVLIHDKKGHLISGLTASDFTLTDNTHPQTIQSFAPSASLPLTLGLVVQTGPGISTWLPEERRNAEKFLTSLLHPSNPRVQAFVIQFNLDIDLLEDPSTSASKLHQAISQLGVPQFSGDNNGAYQTTSRHHHHHKRGSGASLYDAIYLASSQVLNKQPGRKAIVVFSDGIDRDSKENLNQAINAAQRHGVAVYAIYFKGEPPPEKFLHNSNRHRGLNSPSRYPGNGWPGSGGSSQPPPPEASRRVNGKKILAEICGRTGGEMFDSKRASLDTLLAQIAQQMNHAYILAYTRTKTEDHSGFHHIRLKPKQKDQHVQMTEGYWLPQK